MRFIPPLALLLAAAIHLLPVSGVLGSDALFRLYRVHFSEPNLLIMMRHRAAMFGVIAGFLLVACYYSELRYAAFGVGLSSALSFIVIARHTGGYCKALARVVAADWLAVAALAFGLVVQLWLAQRR